ncbi:MAG: hypothetical protein P8Y66_10985 [Nitrospirota bacterium]
MGQGRHRTKGFFLALMMAALTVLGCAPLRSGLTYAPRMSPEKLRASLGEENLVVLDVRDPRQWQKSEYKIKGAVREDPGEVASWAGKYSPGETLVLYCD